MSFIERQLKKNEELIAVTRKHWLAFFSPTLIVIIVIFLDFFFIFPLLNWGRAGQIIFVFFLVVGLFLLLRLMVKIKYNLTLITDERVIRVIQRGIFHRLVTEIETSSITEVLYRVKGICQTIFRYGTIILRVRDKERPLIIRYVRQPSEIQQLILNLQKMGKASQDEF